MTIYNKEKVGYEYFSSAEEKRYLDIIKIGDGQNGPFFTIFGLGMYQPNCLQKEEDFMLNFLQKVQSYVTAEGVTDGASKMQQDKHNNVSRNVDGGAGLKVKVGPPTNFSSNQHPSFYKASTKAVLKSLPFKRGRKVIFRTRIGQTEEEFRQQNEELIVSDIIKYEGELGRRPEWLDLLCRFSILELKVVEQELRWIYPHLFEPCTSREVAVGSPKVEVIA